MVVEMVVVDMMVVEMEMMVMMVMMKGVENQSSAKRERRIIVL